MHMSTTKVELYAAIRQDPRAGLLVRALERKYGVTWRTIRRAPNSHWPEQRKSCSCNIIETGTDSYHLAQTKAQAERATG